MSTAKPLTEPAIASQDPAADDSGRAPTHGSAKMIGPEALHAIGELPRPPPSTARRGLRARQGGLEGQLHPRQRQRGKDSASFRQAVECVRLAHRGCGRVKPLVELGEQVAKCFAEQDQKRA